MTRSRTSCVATSAFFSSRNATTTCDTPSDEVEVSVSIPLMVLTASSILSVTSLSTCSGAAPGSRVVTRTVGMSTLGNWSMPSWLKENTPITLSDRISTDANTGRRTHSAASHCMMNLLSLGDACAVGELRHVASRHDIASLETTGDLDQFTHRLAGRDEAFLGGAVAPYQVHPSGTRHFVESQPPVRARPVSRTPARSSPWQRAQA